MSKNRYPGVYKRGATWSYRAQFGEGEDRWGVSKGGYATAKEAHDARTAAIRDARTQQHRGVRHDPKLTLGDWIERWIEDHVRTVRETSAIAYRSRARWILAHPLAKRRLTTITDADCRRIIADKRETGARHATLSSMTAVLRSALLAAYREGILAENPMARIRIARTTAKFEPKVWSVEEARRFLAHHRDAGSPLYPAFHLALTTGMRKGEIHGLRYEDVDFDRGLLHVRRQRTSTPQGIIEQAPKTDGSEAPIVLDAGTLGLLAAAPWPSGYLVAHPDTGRPYGSMTCFDNHWAKACEEAGVPRIRFHDLRHTCASLLADAGVPLVAAKTRLRHWSTAMTERYTHALDTAAAEVADTIAGVLGLDEEAAA